MLFFGVGDFCVGTVVDVIVGPEIFVVKVKDARRVVFKFVAVGFRIGAVSVVFFQHFVKFGGGIFHIMVKQGKTYGVVGVEHKRAFGAFEIYAHHRDEAAYGVSTAGGFPYFIFDDAA